MDLLREVLCDGRHGRNQCEPKHLQFITLRKNSLILWKWVSVKQTVFTNPDSETIVTFRSKRRSQK